MLSKSSEIKLLHDSAKIEVKSPVDSDLQPRGISRWVLDRANSLAPFDIHENPRIDEA